MRNTIKIDHWLRQSNQVFYRRIMSILDIELCRHHLKNTFFKKSVCSFAWRAMGRKLSPTIFLCVFMRWGFEHWYWQKGLSWCLEEKSWNKVEDFETQYPKKPIMFQNLVEYMGKIVPLNNLTHFASGTQTPEWYISRSNMNGELDSHQRK